MTGVAVIIAIPIGVALLLICFALASFFCLVGGDWE